MNSDFIQPCSLSPIKNHHHQFIVELDALCRALTVLEDLILEQTEEKQEHDKEYSLYQKVVPYFEKCLARFRDLRSDECSYEFGEELARDVSEAFGHITEMLILLEEKITAGGGDGDSDSHKNTLFKDIAGINTNSSKDSTDGNSTGSSWYETILEGVMMGKKMQTRFEFIWKRGNETVAGIRDLNLGPKGRSVIRFDLGRKFNRPHINIDPRGFSNRKNPHIDVPASVVSAAPYVQKGLGYLGSALTVVSIAADSYRMYCAGKEDYDKKFQDEIDIKRLEVEIALIRTFLLKLKKENLLMKEHSLKDYVLLKEKDLEKKKHSMEEYVLLDKYVLLKEDDSLKENDSSKEYVFLKKQELLSEEDLKDSLKKYVLLKKLELLKEEDLFKNVDSLKVKDLLKDCVVLKKEDLSKEYFFLSKQNLIKEDSRLEDSRLDDSRLEDSPFINSLKYAILEYEFNIQVIKNGQNVPVKSIKTGSTIAGGLAGATVGGSLGATYGAAASGAAAGLVFGPPGAMVGAFVGAVSGALGGGIWGGMKGSAAGELVAEKTLEKVLGQIDMDTHEEEESKLEECEKKRL